MLLLTSACKSVPTQYKDPLLIGVSMKTIKKNMLLKRQKAFLEVLLKYKTKCLSYKSEYGTHTLENVFHLCMHRCNYPAGIAHT